MANKILFLVDRVGPYHRARLAYFRKKLGSDNLIVIAERMTDNIYHWESISPTDDFSFRVKSSIFSIIKAVYKEQCSHVVIPGWGRLKYLVIIWLSTFAGKKVVILSDSHSNDGERNKHLDWLKGFLLLPVKRFFVAGRIHEDYVRTLSLRPVLSIERMYDVVDVEYFNSESHKIRDRRQNLLFVGRLVPKKGLNLLLLAYDKLVHEMKEVPDLYIYGEGTEKDQLDKMIQGNPRLKNRVFLMGNARYEDLPKIYTKAKCTIVPSISEQWGLVVNESLACSTPVILSSTCGSAEMLESGGGLVFEGGNVISLKDSLIKILTCSQEKYDLIRREAEIIAKDYSIEQSYLNFKTLL